MNTQITNDIMYVGVNDHEVDLFEGQYAVPHGMSYNSYVILDEKIAVMDTVDIHFTHEWLDQVEKVLNGKKPDYLIVQHMEPDHSANIMQFLKAYPDTTIVGNTKTFQMMEQFFHQTFAKKMVVKDQEQLSLGRHTLTFVFAPMVHWPEVMVTYDQYDKILFSADGFGKFGALDVEEEWIPEARRYYIGIVGKYGAQVQALLKKAATLDIQKICPLHGPVLTEHLGDYIRLYQIWSSYQTETEGILIAYTSIYGHTKQAVECLAERLKADGCPQVVVKDLARDDMAEAVADAFRYGKIIFATTTYNASVFPFMHTFLDHLIERNFQNKTVGFIENGSWAPLAAKIMKEKLSACKNITFVEPVIRILSSPNAENQKQIEALSKEMTKEYVAQDGTRANKQDLSALFHIGYGLYVATSSDGKKDNGFIVNTVTQLTANPLRIGVAIHKDNYSHHIIKQTGKMNINCLTEDAPFSLFETFGFVSGRNTNKFERITPLRSDNGLAFLPQYINAVLSLQVEDYVDFGTHGFFVCNVTEARVISDKETMTYTYYQNHVKPKPERKVKGFVCKVCGYVYEGEELPEDFVCPLCKHGAADFEKIE